MTPIWRQIYSQEWLYLFFFFLLKHQFNRPQSLSLAASFNVLMSVSDLPIAAEAVSGPAKISQLIACRAIYKTEYTAA